MEDKLDRLETLTYFIEFGENQMAKGSPYTSGWFNYDWYKTVEELRASLPADVVKEFDENRKRKQHRPGCRCILCTG